MTKPSENARRLWARARLHDDRQPGRPRIGGRLIATVVALGLAAVAAIGVAAPSSAHNPSAASAGHADFASYQQFARCMRGQGFPQWPSADPARPGVFAVAPQAAANSKQLLGQAAHRCGATAGSGDITLVAPTTKR